MFHRDIRRSWSWESLRPFHWDTLFLYRRHPRSIAYETAGKYLRRVFGLHVVGEGIQVYKCGYAKLMEHGSSWRALDKLQYRERKR